MGIRPGEGMRVTMIRTASMLPAATGSTRKGKMPPAD